MKGLAGYNRPMKRSEKVSHLMTSEPLTVHEKQKPSDARALLREHNIHHVPVVRGSKFVGLISTNDLLRVSYGDAFAQDTRTVDALLDTLTITQVMVEDIVTATPDTTIREVAETLANGAFHCIPIVDAAGDLKGVVTTTDLIRHLLAQY